jgi:hypothetical protein
VASSVASGVLLYIVVAIELAIAVSLLAFRALKAGCAVLIYVGACLAITTPL